MSAVCGLRFTDFTRVAFFLQAKISIHINCSRQSTKQSRDLSVCLCYSLLIINNTSKQKGCFVSLKGQVQSKNKLSSNESVKNAKQRAITDLNAPNGCRDIAF